MPLHLRYAEPPLKRDPALSPTATRRSRLRFHLEHNSASAGDVAGTSSVEFAAGPGRAKDVAVGIEGKPVVPGFGSVSATEEAIQNRLCPGTVGIGCKLVDNATAATRVFEAREGRAAAVRDYAVENPRGIRSQAGIGKSSIRFAGKFVDEALLDFPFAFRGNLEHRALQGASAILGRADQITRLVKDQTGKRIPASAGVYEAIQRALCPGSVCVGRQFEHRAAETRTVRAAAGR